MPLRRSLRHAGLAGASLAIAALAALLWRQRSVAFAISMATAYVALLFLTVTLSIGPWQVLYGRRPPVSSYVRRDFGIWAGILALVHVAFGLAVHMDGNVWVYFFRSSPNGRVPLPRFDPFGLTNDLGLLAALMLLALLTISNNLSLRRLGSPRWKAWQRSSYWAVAAIALHAAIYQWIEHRAWEWLVVCWLLFGVILGLQCAARQKHPGR